MTKQPPGLLPVLSLLLVIQTGCSLPFRTGLGDKADKKSADFVTVQVEHWLEQPQWVELPDSSATLASALSRSQNVVNETLKKSLSARARGGMGDLSPRDFRDDCIVILRDNQFWYFPSAMLMLPEISALPLRPNDSIATIPAFRSVFFSDEDRLAVAVTIVGTGQGVENAVLDFSAIETIVKRNGKLNKYVSTPDFSLAIVSRRLAGTLHHLVVPSRPDKEADMSWYGDALTSAVARQLGESSAGNLKFQDGDVICLTHLGVFAENF